MLPARCAYFMLLASAIAVNDAIYRSGSTGLTYSEQPQLRTLKLCFRKCPKNAICSGFNKCSCNSGYRMSSYLPRRKPYCEPICEQRCAEHAQCVAPNVCHCQHGYHLDATAEQRCVPVCVPACANDSSCIAPGQCAATSERSSNQLPTTNSTEPCLAGYKRSQNICTPVCEKPCAEHSYCLAPDYCQCYSGYKRVQDACAPVCEPTCAAPASCVAPNMCTCAQANSLQPSDACAQNSERDCIEKLNLLFFYVQVTCQFDWFVLLFWYGLLASVGFALYWLFSRACQRLKLRCKRQPLRHEEVPFIITYQPQTHETYMAPTYATPEPPPKYQ